MFDGIFDAEGTWLLWLVVAALLVFGAFLFWSARAGPRRPPARHENTTEHLRAEYARDDALAILRARYENGEIDRATYEQEVEAIRRQTAA